eukprot:2940467-Rhodomonas_salina.2
MVPPVDDPPRNVPSSSRTNACCTTTARISKTSSSKPFQLQLRAGGKNKLTLGPSQSMSIQSA